MLVTQFYETTIIDRESDNEMRFIVIPRRAFSDASMLPAYEAKDNKLDEYRVFGNLLEELTGGFPHHLRLTQIPSVIAECLTHADSMEDIEIDWKDIAGAKQDSFDSISQFAELATFSPIIPFEHSPLAADSIGSVITKASGVGLGAYAGFTVAGNTILLFVAVPAGMIIFGAAAGIASALEQGLRHRLLKMIKGDSGKPRAAKRA